MQQRVFGADGCVVEAGGNRMSEGDLAIFILEQITVGALKNAGCPARAARSVVAQAGAASAGFHADELHGPVFEIGMKDADRVAATADAGDVGVRQEAFS